MIANFFKRYLPVVLLLATVMIAQRGNGQIVLNEVKVRPELAAGTPPNGLIYEGSKEYVELYNAGCTPVNVAGYYIAMRTQPFSTLIQGGTMRIPDVPAATIPARSHIVIAPASAAPSADIDIVITSANVPYCTYGGTGKFSIVNLDGWIALYDATGKPIDGMYWTADPNNIKTLPDFVGDLCLPAGSPITVLPTVLDIYNTDPTKMKYVGGNFINDSILVRQVDGTGDWVRNQPSSITKSAPSGNCNGGTCSSAVPTFNSIAPICVNTTAPALPTTSTNGIEGTWNPTTISTTEIGTKSYTFTPNNPTACASTPVTLQVTVKSCTETFGEFATAVYVQTCASNVNSNSFYNTTGSGVNLIDPVKSFTNFDFGKYFQNSGELKLNGAEVKTFKKANSNVCGANFYYRIYPSGSTPGSFSQFSLPFFQDCPFGGVFPSGGPCNLNDQKWQLPGSSSPSNIDLTALTPNNYVLEVYYEIKGSFTSSTDCSPDVVLVNNNGSNYKANFTILAPASITSNSPVCENNSINLTGSDGATSYTWSGPNSFTSTDQNPVIPNATALNAGVYSLTQTLSNGCNVSTTTANVDVTTAPALPGVTSPVTYCQGDNAAALSATGTSLLWYTEATGGTGSGTAPTPSTSIVGSTDYYVSQSSACGEGPRSKITVTVNSLPVTTLTTSGNTSINSGDEVVLNGTVTGTDSYLWSSSPVDASLATTGSLNPTVKPTNTTIYTLTATTNQGCKASSDLEITVVLNCVKVYNAFSPNGDGINDFWKVYDQFDCLKKVKVNVYNRYGSKVYESSDYKNTWNGLYSGKPVPDATYYAVIEYFFVNGKTIVVKSDVSIVR